MNRTSIRVLPRCAALAAGLAFGVATQAAVEPSRFEVGWPLELAAEGGYFDIALTHDVYRHAPTLEQLAVLDAANEPLPFYRVSTAAPRSAEQRVVLGVSPVYEAQPGGAVAQVSVAAGDGRTDVTVVRPVDGTRTDVVAFVVDARAVERAPSSIELDWRGLPQPFLLDVRVEQSDDLTNWRPVGRGSVAQLSVGGAEARHSRVPLSARSGGYFRVVANRSVADWYLERVTLVGSETSAPALETARLRALDRAPAQTADASSPAVLYFDAGGPLPTEAATVDFVADSGWLTADVAVADSLDGPWATISYGALFYELDYEGTRFASPPLAVGVEKRYWRLTPAQPIARDRVELELRYGQELLRVAANGRAPYLLAAGTRVVEAGPDATFAAVWQRLGRPAAPARATLGPLRELGGAAALVEPYVFPWRSAVLWLVLGVGVIAVGLMAVRLAREMQDKPT